MAVDKDDILLVDWDLGVKIRKAILLRFIQTVEGLKRGVGRRRGGVLEENR